MTRNLKALGLALVAVFAMSAMAASAAQAAPKITLEETPGGHVSGHVRGSQTAANPLLFHEITNTGPPIEISSTSTIKCEEANFEGTLATGESEELSVTPEFKGSAGNPETGCTASGLPATVTTNGCTFRFHNAVQEELTMTYSLQADLVCPKGVEGIEVHAYVNKAHTINACTITVKPENNQNLGGITAHVNTEKPTDLKLTIDSVVKYSTTGACGVANKEATYTGEVTLKGFNTAGTQIDLDISG